MGGWVKKKSDVKFIKVGMDYGGMLTFAEKAVGSVKINHNYTDVI